MFTKLKFKFFCQVLTQASHLYLFSFVEFFEFLFCFFHIFGSTVEPK